jgi:uncharacterized protein (TIGR02284 family)
MKTNERAISILNDLIRINIDRIEGYQKAINEIKDSSDFEIKTVYSQMEEESRKYRSSLTDAVTRLGGEPATDTSSAGDIYRAWMDVKTTFTSDDVLATLQLCEYGEDKALQAYKDALAESIDWPAGLQSLIENQRAALKKSHDQIKSYRDRYAHAH